MHYRGTKEGFIKKHPKSYLAKNLAKCNWSDDTEIVVIGGLEAPNNPRSNLYKALEKSKLERYVVGGHRQRGPDGFWIAVA